MTTCVICRTKQARVRLRDNEAVHVCDAHGCCGRIAKAIVAQQPWGLEELPAEIIDSTVVQLGNDLESIFALAATNHFIAEVVGERLRRYARHPIDSAEQFWRELLNHHHHYIANDNYPQHALEIYRELESQSQRLLEQSPSLLTWRQGGIWDYLDETGVFLPYVSADLSDVEWTKRKMQKQMASENHPGLYRLHLFLNANNKTLVEYLGGTLIHSEYMTIQRMILKEYGDILIEIPMWTTRTLWMAFIHDDLVHFDAVIALLGTRRHWLLNSPITLMAMLQVSALRNKTEFAERYVEIYTYATTAHPSFWITSLQRPNLVLRIAINRHSVDFLRFFITSPWFTEELREELLDSPFAHLLSEQQTSSL